MENFKFNDFATNYVVHVMDENATEHNFIMKIKENTCIDSFIASAIGLNFLNISLIGVPPNIVKSTFKKMIVIKKEKNMTMKDIYAIYLARKQEICNSSKPSGTGSQYSRTQSKQQRNQVSRSLRARKKNQSQA